MGEKTSRTTREGVGKQAAEKLCAHAEIPLACTSGATGAHYAGYSKRPFSKAAASEEARRTLRYVEPLSAARTPLADFFSILLEPIRKVRDNAIHVERPHRLPVADVAVDP
jgi:hypothetical protein